ncbi:MAG: ribosome maturation factor RimM [Candidatus Marinimicrobia bacterium]|nr:ribosome maturation factor RimM [Candidatus Neomarinimicrobiota bacterium]
MSSTPPPDLVLMGKILKPRGLKGEVWASIFNERDSALKRGCIIWLQRDDEPAVRSEIESLKIADEKSWMKLKKIDSRTEAESLQGMHISFPRSEFPPLMGDDYYLVDLIGVTVKNENGISLGTISDTIQLPAHNVIVVMRDGKEFLVPFVDAHIMLFDKKNKILIVKNVDGLLE